MPYASESQHVRTRLFTSLAYGPDSLHGRAIQWGGVADLGALTNTAWKNATPQYLPVGELWHLEAHPAVFANEDHDQSLLGCWVPMPLRLDTKDQNPNAGFALSWTISQKPCKNVSLLSGYQISPNQILRN